MRALLLPSGVGRSHLTRLVLVGQALRQRGAEVAFAFVDTDPVLAWHGFEVFRVPDATIHDFNQNVYTTYSPGLVEACVEAERQAVAAFRPDVLVSDLRLSAAISAAVTGVPLVSVINAYLARQFDPAIFFDEDQHRPRRAVATLIGRGVQVVQKRTAIASFQLVARRFRVKGLRSLDDFLEGDRTLLADLPAYCPLQRLPDSSRYIGPLVWEGSPILPTETPKPLESTRPLIYATTGNTGARQLVELVLDAFSNDDNVQVIMTTGAYLDTSDLNPPSHIRLERFLSGSDVLSRAVAAIHCGGNGTTYQVLGQGKPAVVVPFNNDQRINALLLMRHRLGLALDPQLSTGRHLRAALTRVSGDVEMAAGLQCFKTLVTGADGPTAAQREIVDLVDAV